jgi:hypothetical protein
MSLIGGAITIKVDGEIYEAKGAFDYQIGGLMYKKVPGTDRVIGTKSEYVVPSLEGKITDAADISIKKLKEIRGATVTLDLSNGKTIVYSNADFSAEGKGNTEEGEVDFAFEADEAEEII